MFALLRCDVIFTLQEPQFRSPSGLQRQVTSVLLNGFSISCTPKLLDVGLYD